MIRKRITQNKQRTQKFSALLLLSFVMGVLLLSFASSLDTTGIQKTSQSIVDSITGALSPVFEGLLGETSNSEFFFAKILIIILIISIVYASLSASGINALTEHAWVLWTVSIIVSILGVRFLTDELIQTIALPNSAFAVAVSAGIPFVLVFLMIRGFAPFAQRLAWGFFAIVFLGLWVVRGNELGNVAFIYPLTAALAVIMAFLEGIIQKYMAQSRMNRAKEAGKGTGLSTLNKLINDAHDEYATQGAGYVSKTRGATVTGDAAVKADVKEYQRRIRALMRT